MTKSGGKITYTIDQSTGWTERITGLSLPAYGDKTADAMKKYAGVLKDLVGDVRLRELETRIAGAARALRYEQLVDVIGESCPCSITKWCSITTPST